MNPGFTTNSLAVSASNSAHVALPGGEISSYWTIPTRSNVRDPPSELTFTRSPITNS
jgi:hypothetical protein